LLRQEKAIKKFGMTIQCGLRWEQQKVTASERALTITRNNWSTRVANQHRSFGLTATTKSLLNSALHEALPLDIAIRFEQRRD